MRSLILSALILISGDQVKADACSDTLKIISVNWELTTAVIDTCATVELSEEWKLRAQRDGYGALKEIEINSLVCIEACRKNSEIQELCRNFKAKIPYYRSVIKRTCI